MVRVENGWIHLRLDERVAAKGVPPKIRERHWASKGPIELTPVVREELFHQAAQAREAQEQAEASGVPLPSIVRPEPAKSPSRVARPARRPMGMAAFKVLLALGLVAGGGFDE